MDETTIWALSLAGVLTGITVLYNVRLAYQNVQLRRRIRDQNIDPIMVVVPSQTSVQTNPS